MLRSNRYWNSHFFLQVFLLFNSIFDILCGQVSKLQLFTIMKRRPVTKQVQGMYLKRLCISKIGSKIGYVNRLRCYKPEEWSNLYLTLCLWVYYEYIMGLSRKFRTLSSLATILAIIFWKFKDLLYSLIHHENKRTWSVVKATLYMSCLTIFGMTKDFNQEIIKKISLVRKTC